MTRACEVETFRDDETRLWGWQCFTCREEKPGFSRPADAAREGERHALCWRKVGFITGEEYCGKHGREFGWPCSVTDREPAPAAGEESR